ncbi:MAG: APC family permease [Holosporaceae bacterium]|jgi:amino acid transporter|nr:APC family permease [Holosporaceae bacterium]
MNLIRFVFGNPLKTENLASEKLTKIRALAIFSSDILSSVAYATEEILLALGAALAGTFSLQIAGIIVGLLIVIVASYWQTIEAYPNSGGAFVVAKENLGEFFGLIAGSALLIDYTLTVAVSLSAGANAIISAFPSMADHAVGICLSVLLLVVISNLRGARESATVLSIPTYFFIGLVLLMIGCGIFSSSALAKVSDQAVVVVGGVSKISSWLVFILVLRAFASGCSVLTGVDTIASGVTAFKNPQYRNAQITLLFMAILLAIMFLGITFLSHKYAIVPTKETTAISLIAQRVFGKGFLYYCVQFATACILFLAANTSFSGFPRLASILAKERYIPTRFAKLGDRLAFSNGIVFLAVMATFLILVFNGDSHSLIPLYSLGVFTSFTLSQAGMVKHWIRKRGANWIAKAALNVFGSISCLITLLIIVDSKFLQGAWIVVVLIPILFHVFRKINRRYLETNTELDLRNGRIGALILPMREAQPKVIVPVSRIHKGTLAALRFASSLSDDVKAVFVNIDSREVERLKLSWRAMNFPMPLVLLSSPYRSVVNPLLDFLYDQDERDPERGKAIVVMPSFVPGQFWQNVLHNQTAAILKTALLYRQKSSEQTRIIVEIPYQMKI